MTMTTQPIWMTRQNPFEPNPELRIWMDGVLVPANEAKLSVFDHGLLYGDGIFEGIRVYGGRIWKEAEHIRRFFESAQAIRLEIPMTPEGVSQAMNEALEANNVVDGYIRLLCTRGVGLLGISVTKAACPSIIVIADCISLYPQERYETGLRCITSSYVRNHPNSLSPRVKSLNYLNNVMAKLEAYDAGADEAIMLNFEGRVSEATGDNLFIVRDGQLYTPPTSEGILDGVTRGVVIELAGQRGYLVEEKQLLRHDVYTADECFLTGTAAEIIAVVMLDKRPIGDGQPGKITRQLQQDFIEARS
jgi:branched-chain amino acid aminotransferase